MDNVLFFDQYEPHLVHEAMCVKCLHRWIEVRSVDTALKELECPHCFEKGYVINTGEVFNRYRGEGII